MYGYPALVRAGARHLILGRAVLVIRFFEIHDRKVSTPGRCHEVWHRWRLGVPGALLMLNLVAFRDSSTYNLTGYEP